MIHYQLAKHLHGLGFSLLPLAAKVPTVKWKRLQGVRCTESDLHTWFAEHDWRPGIITGGLSGGVVVECDAHATAAGIGRAGWGSPTQQATRRGRHFVFRHPGQHTRNRRRVGGVPVDIRGDGGYVVAYDDAAAWTAHGIAAAPIYSEPRM